MQITLSESGTETQLAPSLQKTIIKTQTTAAAAQYPVSAITAAACFHACMRPCLEVAWWVGDGRTMWWVQVGAVASELSVAKYSFPFEYAVLSFF